jgi:hypothetical protein
MIPALIALISLLLGGGSPEIFYVDNVDKGVKKYVVDKDIKKELSDTLKITMKEVEDFRSEQKKEVKVLKQLNLNKSSTEKAYVGFFDMRNQARIALHAHVIDMRLYVQTKIKPAEWEQVMDDAEASAKKKNVKAAKKATKTPKDIFKGLESAINKHVTDDMKKTLILDALSIYETAFNTASKTKSDIDVENNSLLSDQNATKADMIAFHQKIAEVRNGYYLVYMAFYFVVQENTTEEEFKPIIKEFNKLLQ